MPLFSTELLTLLHTPEAIHAPEFSSFPQEGWEKLAQLARHQNVAPILYHLLKNNGGGTVVPAPVFEMLQLRFKQNTLRNLKLQTEFHRAVTALHGENIPVLALKGMYLAAVVYPAVGMRRMVDVDFLFRQDDIPRAVAIFQEIGYTLPRKLAGKMATEFADMHHIPPMKHKNGTTVELHARLTRPNTAHTVSPELWWDDKTKITVAGIPVDVLSMVDLLLHLCIHISFHHKFRMDIRHYYDVFALLAYLGETFDWRECVARAKQREWGKGVASVLRVTDALFPRSLPPEVLAQLGAAESASIVPLAVDEMWISFPKAKVFFSKTVAQIEDASGMWEKIRYAWRRVFIPREVMAQKYPVAADSVWLNFFYLRRLPDLIFRHGSSVWKLSRHEPEITATARRKKAISRWLTGT